MGGCFREVAVISGTLGSFLSGADGQKDGQCFQRREPGTKHLNLRRFLEGWALAAAVRVRSGVLPDR